MVTASALYDYNPVESDELALRKDDSLEILEKHEDDWWLVRRGNDVGLIPSNYVYVTMSSPKEKLRVPSLAIGHDDTSHNNIKSMKKQTKIPKLVTPSIGKANGTNQYKYQHSNHNTGVGNTGYGVGNVTDLQRLKELRQEADKKIVQLRNAVSNQELKAAVGRGAPMNSNVNQKSQQLQNIRNPPISSASSIGSSNGESHILKRLQDVFNQESTQVISETDGRLIEQIKAMMQNHHSESSFDQYQEQIPITTNNHSSHPQHPSKPNISVNKAGPRPHAFKAIKHQDSPPDHMHSHISSSIDSNIIETPRAVAGNDDDNGSINTSPISFAELQMKKIITRDSHQRQLLSPVQSSVVVEGIRYPHCRSLVYRPNNSPSSDDAVLSSPPTTTLALKHVYGYDGDFGRHGGSIRGKNVMFVTPERIIFPAAALIIIMDIDLTGQGFFAGHTEDVTCVTIHPDRTLCASGQMGKDGRICIWNQSSIEIGHREQNPTAEVYMGSSVRGVCGLNFSGDGQFLVALGIDDSHTLVVFDWLAGSIIASAKVGHAEVYQMGFNPYCFIGVDRFLTSTSNSKQQLPIDDTQQVGCYTLVSCGGRQIKFWTLKKYLERDDQINNDNSSGFKGRPVTIPKNRHHWTPKYVLEGTNGIFPKNGHDIPDITCFVSVCDDDSEDENGQQKSRIFTGTSSGAIYIWQQLVEHSNYLYTTWQAKGRLLSVVTDVSESCIYDMDYSGRWSPYDAGAEKEWCERLITCGKDGIINVWKVHRPIDSKSLPFEHLSGVNINSDDHSMGSPRSIHWDLNANLVVIGTTGNAISILSGDGLMTDKIHSNPMPICVDCILRGHSSKVRRVAAHPTLNVFLTVSSDKTARVWSNSTMKQLASHRFAEKVSCAAFTPDGYGIAVGNEIGELIVLECSALTNHPGAPADHFRLVLKKDIAAKTGKVPHSNPSKKVPLPVDPNATPDSSPRRGANGSSSSGSGSGNKDNLKKIMDKKFEVMDMKFSPSGDVLAIGCRDNLIHLLSVTNNYKRFAVCRGHSSHIKNLDFSSDGTVLQSADIVRELLFWNTTTGKQINNAYAVRNIDWYTWTCVHGWPVQGVFNGISGVSQEGEINAVCRSNDGTLIVAGASNTVNSAVKLYRYPCLEYAVPLLFGGHTSPALDVTFTNDDSSIISVGGNDTCIFVWEVKK